MKLMFHNDWRGNFGDDLNKPFFDAIAPNYSLAKPELSLYGIGTLLNDANGIIKDSVIFGSGFGYGTSVRFDPETTKIFGVRGPMTAVALGIDPSANVIGDPAMYLERLPSFMKGNNLAPSKKVVATHHRTSELWDFSKKNNTEFYFLDPGLTSIGDYIATIRDASIVYTESLHGAIMAATFGVPFVPVSIKSKLEERKWADFFALIQAGNFRSVSIAQPKLPIFRRIRISAKARKIVSASKLGTAVDSVEIARFAQSLKNIDLSTYAINTEKIVVNKIQDRIGVAAERFSEYVERHTA